MVGRWKTERLKRRDYRAGREKDALEEVQKSE
jgi:hypothetical protein